MSYTTKKNNLKLSPLSEIEWTTLWMAIRYAMNRQTIASATLPEDVIKAYYHRLSEGQRKSIVRDLADNEEMFSRMDGHSAFGSPTIDRPHWLRFWYALDDNRHYQVKLTNGEEITVFDLEGEIIPLQKYIEEPHRNWFVPKENRQGPGQ